MQRSSVFADSGQIGHLFRFKADSHSDSKRTLAERSDAGCLSLYHKGPDVSQGWSVLRLSRSPPQADDGFHSPFSPSPIKRGRGRLPRKRPVLMVFEDSSFFVCVWIPL